MESVNIRQARRRLSEIVAAAERGESITITRRGKPAAQIAPIRRAHHKGLPDLAEFRATLNVTGKPLSKVVIDNRKGARY